jgi:hypothetical protein
MCPHCALHRSRVNTTSGPCLVRKHGPLRPEARYWPGLLPPGEHGPVTVICQLHTRRAPQLPSMRLLNGRARHRRRAGGKEAVSYQPPPADKDHAAARQPPGWYPDPRWYLHRTGPQVLRWWDGAQWGQQTRPLPGRAQEPQLGYPQQPYGQHPRPPFGHYGWPPRTLWPRRHKVLTVLGGLAALIIIGGIASAASGGNARQTGNASPVAATLTHTATPSPAPTHHATKKKTRPHETPVTAQATTPAPAATAPAAAPSHPAAPAPAAAPSHPAAATSAGCHPLSDEDTCYKPGEYCRDADHGASGIAGDGKAITCKDNDGWRWEPA